MNEEKPPTKIVKKVQFFDAKQHVEIIRQVKGETAFTPRQPTPPRINKK